jgi:hypothetical protein
LVAFWCASAVDSTIAAVMWVLPVTITLGIALGLGAMAAFKSMGHLTTALHTFASVRSVEGYAAAFSASSSWGFWFDRVTNLRLPYSAALVLPLLLFGAYQSYRQFQRPAQRGWQFVVHTLLPLSLAAFLYSSAGTSAILFRQFAMGKHFDLMNWLHESVQVTANTNPLIPMPIPLQLVDPELIYDPYLPESLRNDYRNAMLIPESWRDEFRGATLTIVPMNPAPKSAYMFPYGGKDILGKARAWRVATVKMSHASDCTDTSDSWSEKSATYTLIVLCK